MVVPGPVTSAMSVGCHELLRDATRRPGWSTGAAHVIETVGSIGDDLAAPPDRPVTARDGLSDLAARVLDACPVRIGVPPERLAHVAGCDVLEVLRVLPQLELAGLVQWTGSGWRLTPPPKPPDGALAGARARRGCLTGACARAGGSARARDHRRRASGPAARAGRGAGGLRGAPGSRSGTCPRTPSGATSPTPCGCSTTWHAAAASSRTTSTSAALRSWLAQGRTRGHSRATTARHSASARSFTALAAPRRVSRPRTSACGWSRPRRAGRCPTSSRPDQARAAVESAATVDEPVGLRDTLALELLYAGGIRVSELVGLDVDDVDRGRRLLRVLGKGRKERSVPYGLPAEAALDAWLTRGRPALVDRGIGPGAAAGRPRGTAGPPGGPPDRARRGRLGARCARHRPARPAALGRDARAGGRRRPPVGPGTARAR